MGGKKTKTSAKQRTRRLAKAPEGRTRKPLKKKSAIATPDPPSRNRTHPWIVARSPESSESGAGAYTGKWMPRVQAEYVDETWKKVAEATEAGRLGTGAKVSTLINNETNPRGSFGQHVICVYTADCRDRADVERVLRELRRLGLGDGNYLSYKEDGATYANIYGRGAALYVAKPGSTVAELRREPVPIPDEILGKRQDPKARAKLEKLRRLLTKALAEKLRKSDGDARQSRSSRATGGTTKASGRTEGTERTESRPHAVQNAEVTTRRERAFEEAVIGRLLHDEGEADEDGFIHGAGFDRYGGFPGDGLS